MKYFLIAGEPSGDQHAANLMLAILAQDSEAQFQYYGGDHMAQVAPGLVVHYRELAIMGFWEVLTHLRTIARNLHKCTTAILNYKPDALILVDFGGFNMRIAKQCHGLGFPIYYYIPPKVWAWNRRRVKKLKAYTEQLYVILPFEVPFFERYGVQALYFGNPLLDELPTPEQQTKRPQQLEKLLNADQRPVVALLPGSRKQELRYNLPRMLEVVESFPDYQFVLCAAGNFTPEFIQSLLPSRSRVRVVYDATWATLTVAHAAIVTSGTATLEAALLQTPEVVVYRGSWPSMLIALCVIRVKWISLVNLILNKPCVQELKQMDYTVERLKKELIGLLDTAATRQRMLEEFAELRQLMGAPGSATRVAADIVGKLQALHKQA